MKHFDDMSTDEQLRLLLNRWGPDSTNFARHVITLIVRLERRIKELESKMPEAGYRIVSQMDNDD